MPAAVLGLSNQWWSESQTLHPQVCQWGPLVGGQSKVTAETAGLGSHPQASEKSHMKLLPQPLQGKAGVQHPTKTRSLVMSHPVLIIDS